MSYKGPYNLGGSASLTPEAGKIPLADASGKIATGWTKEELEAIAAEKAVTAVDVFVYDTSKDSDGGAWRKRTQHTSWYNETLNTATRGSRKEFPAVAVIVAEADKVTIYDGDDPSMPMWKVLNPYASASSCVTAVNGQILIGNDSGSNNTASAGVWDFRLIEDVSFHWATTGSSNLGYNIGVSSLAQTVPVEVKYSGTGLVHNDVNDVALTVLPNAPIDPATGLPVPTIACLVGESEVTLADGSTKRIDQVEVGSIVKTLEGEHEVLNWWDQGVKDVIELEFDGGQKLICTADHKIRTTDGWVEAGDLTAEHEVVGL